MVLAGSVYVVFHAVVHDPFGKRRLCPRGRGGEVHALVGEHARGRAFVLHVDSAGHAVD